ncbi:hypothetical protein [Streptomyces sp. NBC_00076]|uniref:hypothetical protein n=1 Tax=Streptomyces sp. NBC_00076 TaxID=2975642 RepID=UPI003253931F
MSEANRRRGVAFSERRRNPRSVDVVLSSAMVVCIVGAPFLWPLSVEVVPRVLIVVCLVVVPALILSFHSRVTVDDECVRLSLVPVWRRTIARSDIVEVRQRAILARDMGGLGLRRTSDGAIGLVMRGKDAVEVTLRDGKRYVLGTDRPGDLLAVLTPAASA